MEIKFSYYFLTFRGLILRQVLFFLDNDGFSVLAEKISLLFTHYKAKKEHSFIFNWKLQQY